MIRVVWIIYAITGAPIADFAPLPEPRFATRERCERFLADAVDQKIITFPPGVTGACWPRIIDEQRGE